MIYTKYRAHDTPTIDSWAQWLIERTEQNGTEYNLLYTEDSITVEFYNADRALEFALEFGL